MVVVGGSVVGAMVVGGSVVGAMVVVGGSVVVGISVVVVVASDVLVSSTVATVGDSAALAPSPLPVPLVTAVEQPAMATSPNTKTVPIFARFLSWSTTVSEPTGCARSATGTY